MWGIAHYVKNINSGIFPGLNYQIMKEELFKKLMPAILSFHPNFYSVVITISGI